MSQKNRLLAISSIILAAIALLLIFSPILKSKPIKIVPGFTYQDTITKEDAPDVEDKDYRRHTYSLSVFVNTTYRFEASSLSDDVILVFEYYGDDKIQLLRIDAMGSGTTDYTYGSAGLKIIYVEALTEDLPADYSLKVTKIGES